MKTKLLSLSALFLFNITINAQIIWQNTIGGASFDDADDVIQTSDGGFLLIGTSESGISGDKTEASNGNSDYWIVKTNSTGAVEWDKTYGGAGNDFAVSAIETADGNFIILGDSDSDISGDKTENSKGSSDIWIIKITNTGTIIWDKTLGGASDEYAVAIKETSTNDLVIVGDSASNISGDKSENSRGSTDTWVIKTNNLGTKIWDKTFGGDADEETSAVALTADGGYILGVIAESAISGDKTTNTSNNEEYWVVKVSNTNTIDWQKSYGGTANSISILTVLIPTSDGGYILAGDSDSNIGGEKTENTNGGSDLWVIKINNVGTIEWQNTLGGADDEYEPRGIEKATGGYVFAVESLSNASGDKSENGNSNDIWLVELDALGNLVGDKTFGTNSTEHPEQVLQTADGNFVVVSSVDEASGDNTETPIGDTDYWMFKVNKSTLHIDTPKAITEIQLFPNPARNVINVQSNTVINNLEIIDLTGKKLTNIKPNLAHHEIDITGLKSGMYILKIYSPSGLATKRFVKQ